MRIQFLLLTFLLSFGLSTSPLKAEQVFSGFIDDLPLMESLYEDADSVLLFDKPQGRIIELKAFSDQHTPESIIGFYTASLPPLGWTALDQMGSKKQEIYFSKGGEVLKIHVNQKDGISHVIFSLSPS